VAKMVEKITVSRDEVLHYSWIDHTWVYIHYTKNSATCDPHFSKIIKMLLERGIFETTGEKFEGVILEDRYVFIQYATDEITDILKNAASWFLSSNLKVKDPQSALGKFYLENKDIFYEFFAETKDVLERRAYKYFFQRVDGMN
jgi:hypothetical protein